MSGLRYETGRDMPPGMQPLAADKIVQRLRNAAPVAAHPASELIKASPVAPQEDPCIDCLRWGECNGVDESCPWRR